MTAPRKPVAIASTAYVTAYLLSPTHGARLLEQQARELRVQPGDEATRADNLARADDAETKAAWLREVAKMFAETKERDT